MREVVLLHGLGSPTWSMAPMARKLRRSGFRVRSVAYSGWSASLDDIVDEVAGNIDRCGVEGPVDLLGHSLGGVVGYRLAERNAGRIRRLVMLGTPLLGSSFADFALGTGVSKLMFRKIWTDLSPLACQRNRAGIDGVELGMIAGVVPGSTMFGCPSDGVVSLSRTRTGGLADHVCVPASHASLLFSSTAAYQAAAFFRNGAFAKGS